MSVKIIIMTPEKKTKRRHISPKRNQLAAPGTKGKPASSGGGPCGLRWDLRPQAPGQCWLSGNLRAAGWLSHCRVSLRACRLLPLTTGSIFLPGLTSCSSPLHYMLPLLFENINFVFQLSDHWDMVPTSPIHPCNSGLEYGESAHNLLWVGKSQRNVPTCTLSWGIMMPKLLPKKLFPLLLVIFRIETVYN